MIIETISENHMYYSGRFSFLCISNYNIFCVVRNDAFAQLPCTKKKNRKCYGVKGCILLFRVKVVHFDVQRWDWLIRMIWCLAHFHDLVSNSQKVFTFPSLCNQYLYSRICWDKFENCTSDMGLIHKWNPAKSSLVLAVTEEMWNLIYYEFTWKTKRTSLSIFNIELRRCWFAAVHLLTHISRQVSNRIRCW